jgi:hypothetical protein
MSILPDSLDQENQENNIVLRFFKEYQIAKLLKQSNFVKAKGYSCRELLHFLVMLVFSGKNLFRYLQADSGTYGKDCMYRFLNNYHYNWRKFLLLLSSQVIRTFLLPLTSADRVNVFIIDDSLYSRSRSKTVELLARIKDHVENRYVRGFRMLTLGWSDGNTFIPIAFSLLSSANEKNRLAGISHKVDKRTNGYKRRKEATIKSTQVLVELLEQAQKNMIPGSYVLFDSWFAFPSVIRKIKDLNLHTICMIKSLHRVYYQYQGKYMNLNDLYASVKKKRGRAKILASIVVGIGKDQAGEPVKAKIIFVRDRNRSRQWLALLSTDLDLQDEEIVRIYGKRWNIEVFFKMTKSYLRLAKEFQGRSYDSMVSHTTVVFVRYIILSLQSRSGKDIRTIGNLFYVLCDELRDINLLESLQRILNMLKSVLQSRLRLTEEEINPLIDYFISGLPIFFKERLTVCSCES